MTALDLATLGAGFSHPSHGSQAVFRAALHALAHPGRPVGIAHDANVPTPGHSASGALLLALLDAGSRLWLSASLTAGGTAAWLRFHTGCTLVAEPALAQFAWVADPDEMPPLDRFAQGSDAEPAQSTTCVIDVPSLGDDTGSTGAGSAQARTHVWIVRGPGVRGSIRLRVGPLSARFASGFAASWAANHASFPRGVDVFLAAPCRIAGLPRTTRIEPEA